MRAFLVAAVVAGIGLLSSGPALTQAQSSSAPSLEGVWQNLSVTSKGGPNPDIPSRAMNINIWTKRYFSRVVDAPTMRPILAAPKDPARLTDAEKLARYEHWVDVLGVSGVYEQKGATWLPYPSVNKSQGADLIARQTNPTAASTPVGGQAITFEGNTLVLTVTSADGKVVTRRTYRRLDQPRPAGARPHPIEGVWKGTSVSVTGGTAPGNPNRQPNMFVYWNGYYTIVRQDGNAPLPPRPVLTPPKDASHLTSAEKLARYEHWQPVAINAGRYEVKGTTLYQYDLVAKNQTADIIERQKTGNLGKANPNSELEFANGNNTMVQVVRSADGKSVTRRTYIRLE